MAAALVPVIGGAAARLGVGLAASKLIDDGINRAVPYALGKAREMTSKYKLTHGLSKGIGKVEGAYNSKAGKVGRTVASLAGSVAAFGGAGKMVGQIGKASAGIRAGAGQVGQGLRAVTKGTRVGRVLEDQIFNPKKGAMITKAAQKFNRAKVNLSEKATRVGGGIKKGASAVGGTLKEGAYRVKEGAEKVGNRVSKMTAKSPAQIAAAERAEAEAYVKANPLSKAEQDYVSQWNQKYDAKYGKGAKKKADYFI